VGERRGGRLRARVHVEVVLVGLQVGLRRGAGGVVRAAARVRGGE